MAGSVDTTLPNATVLSVADFASLGIGEVAYVREMSAEDVQRLVPQVQGIPTGIDLYALLGADGTPIMIADSREDITASAWQNKLVTVSVH
ncbi:MAG: DUF1150 domain-containing protein [Sphingopyxis sp.]|nr:DUF1150 domain-containing protein [Sphingopyxis sp.]